MEVSVENAVGIPEGSILSIRAGNVRRQGTFPAVKPVRFTTSPLTASPFKVDVFAPLGSARLVLKPKGERYAVSLGPENGGAPTMNMDLVVKEMAADAEEDGALDESRQLRKQRAMGETQAYIEEHEIVQFVQNLMASVLAEKPADPFAYMEKHLRDVREGRGGLPIPAPILTSPTQAAQAPAAAAQEPLSPKSKAAVRRTTVNFAPAAVGLQVQPKNFSGPCFTVENYTQQIVSTEPLSSSHVIKPGSEIRRLRIQNLSENFRPRNVESPLTEMTANFQDANSTVTQTISYQSVSPLYYQMHRAGPRQQLHFDPKGVVATIVTCGGLCPGLNAVIRELVMMLYMYGANKIWGVRGGYNGVVDPHSWIELTPEHVQDIHTLGGTILVSGRGNPTEEDQLQYLQLMGVRAHFIIGGDGTHKGAYDMTELMRKKGYECAVVGIPKTIDNDIPFLDRTFGFDTACTEAERAIDAAYVESTCNEHCIGLVKLMGRHCGFIAQNACLAARHVDIALLPEMDIAIDKVLSHCIHLIQTKGHAVIVVAEGCGSSLIGDTGEVDAGGNKKLADVGPWLRDKIAGRFKEVKLPLSVKYIDPTYMIRAVRANANDSVYCASLAHNAVHSALSGYTGVTIAQINQRFVMLPMQCVTKLPLKKVALKGRWFRELVNTTGQPDLAPADATARLSPVLAEPKGNPLIEFSDPVDVVSCLGPDDEVRRLELEHLSTQYGEKSVPTTVRESVQGENLDFEDKASWVVQTMGAPNGVRLQMLKAGPRHTLHFNPEDVAATIVTCGGLCPGLNSVIRELVMMLYTYGVRKVYGIKGGFKGVVNPQNWITLTPETVKDIHMQGGSILVSDRGNPPHLDMAKMLQKKGVRQHFVLGGDGTQKGAYQTYEQMQNIGWECAVVGIPKTIDNDINLLDRSFGFDSAMAQANNAIDVAYVEATCNANCIGLVKLMGRHCGYLTMMSVIAARHVDICLLPEMDIEVDKVLSQCVNLLNNQGHAVIVVAEGCGDTLLSQNSETDAGGNKKISDVGPWLKDAITDHFKTLKLPVTIKYVDPTYMVRAVPANANDSIYCSVLAQAAVHAAMTGYTGITVGKVDSSVVYLPIKMLTSLKSRTVDTKGRWFERLLATTQQPHFGGAKESAKPIDPMKDHIRTPLVRGRTARGSFLFNDPRVDAVRVPDTKLTIVDGLGQVVDTRALQRGDILMDRDEIRELPCFHLSDRYGRFKIPSPLKGKGLNLFQDDFSWTSQAMYLGFRVDSGKGQPYFKMIRAGARQELHFDPYDPASCAAIVSCGGICPGLNSVIREIVMTLWSYGVRRIYGIRGGYKGVVDPSCWIQLTPDMVANIHLAGGTMLISDRGNPPHIEMAKTLQAQGVAQYFVLGGDGTHKGAMQTFDCCLEIDHECAVIGVPKTIDNDVPMFDQTFGFDTACTEAVKAVNSAYVEACCNANCIGLVKLMGRHCGFIAMNAALAARHVDVCLLPEMEIDLEKVLKHLEYLMKEQGHAVIVVAEGCGDTLLESASATDAGGNKILADVGPWLKDAIAARFKKEGLALTIKYIDPTYMIRSVPANSFDSAYCSVLGQNAVHGAMAGYSGVTVGKVYERYVYLPIHAITQQKGKRVHPKGRWFSRLIEMTKQPDFSPEGCCPMSPHVGPTVNVLEALSTPGNINNLLQTGDEICRLEVINLGDKFASAMVQNPATGTGSTVYLNENSWSTQTFVRANKRDDRGHVYYQMLRSGPRQTLHFDPARSSAVIVTCGGLCPGLNSVIREIVMTLRNYGVETVYGCIGGYKGMVQPDQWITLTPEVVKDIDKKGGTILVSDRGNPPHIAIAKTLQSMSISQYFVIGGDGTQTGAFDTFTCTQQIGHEVAVVGVPKTIDNDIPILDRSFGFNTACSEAEKAIDSAYVEASCNTNCIGLVKLMGRNCGFIAMHATLAARNVDICLLPEMTISLPQVFTHAMHLMKKKGHAVIVVAEGCGDTLLKSSGERDAGGNKKLADVGPWLKDQLLDYFKKMHQPLTIKYIDPTYTIRAVPANTNDSVYCSVLAQHAVHGAMAGYSGIVVGRVDERFVMLPTHAITKTPPRRVDLKSRQYERMVATTGQPSLAPGPGDDWALLPAAPLQTPMRNPTMVAPKEIKMLEWKELLHKEVQCASAATLQAKLRVLDGYGTVQEERMLEHVDLLEPQDEIRKLEVMHLADKFGKKAFNTQLKMTLDCDFCDSESWSMEPMSSSGRVDSGSGRPYYQMLRAGPREYVHFDVGDPDGCAAIVTCGGLCPGQNVVIRGIVHELLKYGVTRIYGIKHGFTGVIDSKSWVELTPEVVQDIHTQGGTILQSERGNPSAKDMAHSLKVRKVRQFFVLGGDGSHRGLMQIFAALMSENHECACVGVPSTVENNIPMVDTSFGFDTACTAARDTISAAYVEATCNANCIGLVKLLGMQTGFLALNATLASRNVDICLLREMEISLDKVLDHCETLMSNKGYAVIVVADGCGASLFRNTGEESKNVDVGPWLRDKILARFKAQGRPLTIKYIDPTYMVRSVKANAYDGAYCSALAEHAVHGAMAGYTSITTVKIYDHYVYIPIETIVKSRKRVNPMGRWYGRMLLTTNQPCFEPDGFTYASRGDGNELKDMSVQLSLTEVLMPNSEIVRMNCANLAEKFSSKSVPNPLKKCMPDPRQLFVKPGSWSTQTFTKKHSAETDGKTYLQLLRCGPREVIHFDPSEPGAAAAIVTCGGLCPGLNTVIREIVKMLHEYGVQTVYGIIGGYKGCVRDHEWIELTDDYVQDIHMHGGSVLVSDRGNPPHSAIAQVLQRNNIRQYFVLGGDGTHKGAMQSFEAMTAIGHECAVVGVPKTIDNDITLIDRTFGFDTACTEAVNAIDSAYVEATTNANCIGLVKLMGRHCGWIAATATIAARHVDCCLIPEMKISLPKLCDYVLSVMKRKQYAVIVVAEGCGDTIISGGGATDAGGNKLLADVGPYLKDQLIDYCKAAGLPITIKYIDPTYMIRSVPANAFDSTYCSVLSQQAVHAAMAGYTGISVGRVNERYVMMPIHSIVDKGARTVNLNGFTFERLAATTGQPSFEL